MGDGLAAFRRGASLVRKAERFWLERVQAREAFRREVLTANGTSMETNRSAENK
jgi:hypothetical protein